MSTQATQGLTAELLSETALAEYLLENPDFFERHSELIAKLQIPHLTSGGTTSLVERQVAILRQRNRKLDSKLIDLVRVAQENSDLAEKIHQLAVNLIGASGLDEVLNIVEATLRENFAADETLLVLFEDTTELQATNSTGFCRVIGRTEPATEAFTTFMSTGKPRCGQLRDAQRDFLFADDADGVASAALIPLGDHAKFGLLAIGSRDADHFNPAMGTEFLDRIGALIAQAVITSEQK